MVLAITPAGMVSNLSEDQIDEATWDDACIHISRRARSAIVSVDFRRVTSPAIAAALYEIADLRPKEITLFGNDNRMSEVLAGFQPAFQRLCDIFNIILSEEDGQAHTDGPTPVEANRDEAKRQNNDRRNRNRYH
jgi:hypothetical protein